MDNITTFTGRGVGKIIEIEILNKSFVAANRKEEKSEFSLSSSGNRLFYVSKNDSAEFLLDDLSDRLALDKSCVVLYLLRNKVIVSFGNVKLKKEAECVELNLSNKEIGRTIAIIKWYAGITSRKNELLLVVLHDSKKDVILNGLSNITVEIVDDSRLDTIVKTSIKSFNTFQKTLRFGILFGLVLLAFFGGKITSVYAKSMEEVFVESKSTAIKEQRKLRLSLSALKAENTQLKNKPYRVFADDIQQSIIKDFTKHPSNNFVIVDGKYTTQDNNGSIQ